MLRCRLSEGAMISDRGGADLMSVLAGADGGPRLPKAATGIIQGLDEITAGGLPTAKEGNGDRTRQRR